MALEKDPETYLGEIQSPLRGLLKSRFGYEGFRPLQEEIIASVLSRRDTLVVMPTGAGKSLCYQLPALRFAGLTLVVSPLIALMKDQVDALVANGIAAGFINSTLSPRQISRVQDDAKNGWLKILYLAPERLAMSGFRNFLRTLDVSLLAIDEAHCISEWGHDFRPDYRNLKILRRDFPDTPVIALTATATERVREDIIAQLALAQASRSLSSFNRPNLIYRIQPKRTAFSALLALLRQHENEPTIIYCFSRKECESLAADLCANGLKAVPYHAGLDADVRTKTQEKFIRDEVPIIVATIAFGMGIDKPDIRLLIHYDLPKSLEGYYQETGRAGRDGLPSDCVLFYSYGDKRKHAFFIDQIEDDTEKKVVQDKLQQVIQLCELQTCRRRYLLQYFGEEWEEEDCGGCDVCLTDREEFDATEIVQKILSAVIRTGQRFGMNHVSEVLRGKKSKRVVGLKHHELSVFGVARDCADVELKDIAGLLVAKGLMVKNGTEYPTLAATEAGLAFLRQQEKIALTRPKESYVESATAHVAADAQYDLGLFETLRDLRARIAAEKGVPAFVIFRDTTLWQIALQFPQTRDSFSRISGVGAVKLEQYSEDFLVVIRDYIRENGLEQRNTPPRQTGRERTALRAGSTYDETRGLLLQKLPIGEIARRRGLTVGTIISHVEVLVASGEQLDLGDLMPPDDRMAKIEVAFEDSGSLHLAPVRESLGEKYSYEEIRLVRVGLQQKVGGNGTI